LLNDERVSAIRLGRMPITRIENLNGLLEVLMKAAA
jgi:hypothetical protein